MRINSQVYLQDWKNVRVRFYRHHRASAAILSIKTKETHENRRTPRVGANVNAGTPRYDESRPIHISCPGDNRFKRARAFQRMIPFKPQCSAVSAYPWVRRYSVKFTNGL